MKCPHCHNDMNESDFYEKFDNCLGIYVKTEGIWHLCPQCNYSDLGWSRFDGDEYNMARQKAIESWILSQIKSFDDLNEKFLCHSKVLKMIKEDNIDRPYPANKTEMIRHLDYWCIFFQLFNRRFYLKKSVEKYLRQGNGLFILNNETI